MRSNGHIGRVIINLILFCICRLHVCIWFRIYYTTVVLRSWMHHFTEKGKTSFIVRFFIITLNIAIIITQKLVVNVKKLVWNNKMWCCSLETRLLQIFQDVHQAYQSLESRMKAEGFRVRVMQIFRAWEDWAVYSKDFLIKLQNTFLGLTSSEVKIILIFFTKSREKKYYHTHLHSSPLLFCRLSIDMLLLLFRRIICWCW